MFPHIEKLHEVYWQSFLPKLENRDPTVLECLDLAHCEIDMENIHVDFKLPKLFDAVWIYASMQGISMPIDTSWKDDFYAFCKPLRFPFLKIPEEISGVHFELKRNVNSRVNNQYRAVIT